MNTGFHRSGKASACVGQGANISYKDFATFGAKAIAGIGRLDATIESRSIPIVLKRRTRAETIAKWRRREAWATADPLRQRAATLTAHTEALRAARPILPDGLSDRAEDVLEPLFALADLAGGDWPDRARLAALALMGTKARVAQETDQNLGLELLADIREIFNDKGNPDALPTQAIIDALKGIEDRPWATFTKGDKPITPHRLRLMLKDFDVVPGGQMWLAGKKTKGYRLAAFLDAFDRYLPRDPDFKGVEGYNLNKGGPELPKTERVGRESPTPLKTAVLPNKDAGPTSLPFQTPSHGEGGAHDNEEDDGDGYFGA